MKKIEKNQTNINAWVLKEKENIENKLATEISIKYKIEKKEALRLIRWRTLESLDSLRDQIELWENRNLDKLSKKEIENLFLTLRWAQEVIENFSKFELIILKEEVENSISPKNILETYLPNELVQKAKNPTQLHEHILWFSLWTANSIIAIVDALYQIWAWIIKTPYHLYLVVSWKAEIDWIDKI